MAAPARSRRRGAQPPSCHTLSPRWALCRVRPLRHSPQETCRNSDPATQSCQLVVSWHAVHRNRWEYNRRGTQNAQQGFPHLVSWVSDMSLPDISPPDISAPDISLPHVSPPDMTLPDTSPSNTDGFCCQSEPSGRKTGIPYAFPGLPAWERQSSQRCPDFCLNLRGSR